MDKNILLLNSFAEHVPKEISIYMHWPFCLSKCPYCDFNSHVCADYLNKDWDFYYCKEIEMLMPLIKGKLIKSIFFGGGTPSLMSPSLVQKIIEKISQYANLAEGIEISLEANPNSSESEKFLEFKKAGINRLSIGVQSLNPEILSYLGRKHTNYEAITAINNALANFSNVSIDIIYASIKHNMQNWPAELEQILSFKTQHLSLYQLVIEKNTKFDALYKLGNLQVIDSNLAYELAEYTNAMLNQYGYIQYEVSNYASSENFICKHNLNYWLYGSYIGFGPGAHSRISVNEGDKKIVYAFNTYKLPRIWKHKVESASPIDELSILNKEEHLTEALFMMLRLVQGVDIGQISSIDGSFWSSISTHPKFYQMLQEKLINYDGKRISLTKKGLHLHTEIIKELVWISKA